jgi:mRNA-degrading endonuclease toxin of MazEF toxin-antitoxin module
MNQGEIWQIGLDPAIGAEMQKARPALIINVNA